MRLWILKSCSFVTWILSDGFELEGQMIDIDELADQYPDCDVGY